MDQIRLQRARRDVTCAEWKGRGHCISLNAVANVRPRLNNLAHLLVLVSEGKRNSWRRVGPVLINLTPWHFLVCAFL